MIGDVRALPDPTNAVLHDHLHVAPPSSPTRDERTGVIAITTTIPFVPPREPVPGMKSVTLELAIADPPLLAIRVLQQIDIDLHTVPMTPPLQPILTVTLVLVDVDPLSEKSLSDVSHQIDQVAGMFHTGRRRSATCPLNAPNWRSHRLIGPAEDRLVGVDCAWSVVWVEGGGVKREMERSAGSRSAGVLDKVAWSGGVLEEPALEVDIGAGMGMGKVAGVESKVVWRLQ